MKILHLANWNSTNIGNGALIFGTERLLGEDIPGLEFVPEAWDEYTFKRKKFDESFVSLVNEHDALLVNGAVTFNAFRRGNKNTGMRFDLPLELWDKIEKPIILYGLSYRCWPFQEYPNKEAFKAWLEYVLANDHRIFFGVRNDGTKEWIRDRFGVESEKIYEVPDPGAFVPHEDHEYPELHPTRKNVIVVFNGEDASYRYATGVDRVLIEMGNRIGETVRAQGLSRRLGLFKRTRREVAIKIARALEKIAAVHDVQIIVTPHYLDDYGMIQDFIEVIQERIAHQLVVSTGLVSVPHTGYFYGRYAKADLAISMRVHSMSPSIGLGIPVVPITSQGRMRNYLKKAGLQDIGVDLTDPNFVEVVAQKANALLDDPREFKIHTGDAMKKMREQARENNKRVEKILNNRNV
jgi:polysaccharide pyruvyl transferase WcaK-like protein